jgi:hypothetical protein
MYAANPAQIQMEKYIPSVFDLRKISKSESKGEKASGEDNIIIIIIIIRFFILNHHLLLFMYDLLKTISIAQITQRRRVRQK